MDIAYASLIGNCLRLSAKGRLLSDTVMVILGIRHISPTLLPQMISASMRFLCLPAIGRELEMIPKDCALHQGVSQGQQGHM